MAPDGEGEGGGPPTGRRTRRQRMVLIALCSFVVLCILGVGVTAYAIRTLGRIERFGDLDLDVVAHGEPVNYLIIGSDERDGVAGKRADTMVLFRVEPSTQQAAVLTIPRDLLVPLSEDGEFDPEATPQKINGAYAGEDGRDDLIDTIRENFGVPIHHYVEITFGGFTDLIDSVGGVQVRIDQAVHSPHTGLTIYETGCVTLDGPTALQLVRSRDLHVMGDDGWELADVTSDLGRGTRQQEFIRQAAGKALDEADPNKIRNVIDALASTVALDDSISVSDMIELVQQFRGIDPTNPEALQSLTLPVVPQGDGSEDDPYQLWPDMVASQPVLNEFRGAPPYEVDPGIIRLEVLNGTGNENEAANVAGAFQELDFGVAPPGDTEERPSRTTLHHAPGEEALALQVARHIEGGAVVQSDSSVGSGDVTLVTGPGLDSIYQEPMPLEELPPIEPDGGGAGSGSDSGSGSGEAGDGDDPGGEGSGPGEGSGGEPPAGDGGGGGDGDGDGGSGGSAAPDASTTTTAYGEDLGGGQLCGG